MKPIRHQHARAAYTLCVIVQSTLLITLALVSAIATTNTRLQAQDAPADGPTSR